MVASWWSEDFVFGACMLGIYLLMVSDLGFAGKERRIVIWFMVYKEGLGSHGCALDLSYLVQARPN